MSIDLHIETRSNSILNAALAVFARYGFKRVSMEDIAQAAGLSRPSLYLVYPNKTAIFTALAQAMADRACRYCTLAWPESHGAEADSFERGLAKSAVALNLDGWRLIKGSPHGAELIASNSNVVGQISLAVEEHFIALIEARLIAEGHNGSLGKMIAAGLHGIKDKAASEEELVSNIEAFAALVTAGLRTQPNLHPV